MWRQRDHEDQRAVFNEGFLDLAPQEHRVAIWEALFAGWHSPATNCPCCPMPPPQETPAETGDVGLPRAVREALDIDEHNGPSRDPALPVGGRRLAARAQ